MIHIKDIEDAKNSPESRPVEQDTQGHWGQVTNGLQLSLRFEKETFTNDEPVIATVLLRNATKSPVTFLRYHISSRPSPVDVLAFKDQKPFPVKGHSDEIEVISANQITIYPQTQCKYRVKLNDYYDLTGGGEFVFRAEYGRQGEISSQDVRIQIQ